MTSDHDGPDRRGAASGGSADAGPGAPGSGSAAADPRGADAHEADLVDVGPADRPEGTEQADEILARAGEESPNPSAGGTRDGDPAADGHSAAAALGDLEVSSEEAVAEAVELAQRLEAERDQYLDALRRLKADFENYKRRVSAQQAEQRSQGALELVRELLPVLDALDAAVEHGSEEVRPLRTQLLQTLEKQGLAVVDEVGVAFDPNVHEAVMHEEGDGEAVVAEVLRTGYLWNGAVVRAAMVKVKG